MSSAPPYAFALCRDEATLDAVFALRRLANVASGRADASAPLSAWRDGWDGRSEIVVARDGTGTVVATVRVSAPEPNDEWLCGPYVDTLSAEARAATAEVSRVAVHPDRRGGGLAVTMAAFMCVLTWRSGRRRCVGCCSEDVEGFWTRLGVQTAPATWWQGRWPMRPRPLMGLTLDVGAAPPTVPHASPLLQRAVRSAWSVNLGGRQTVSTAGAQ